MEVAVANWHGFLEAIWLTLRLTVASAVGVTILGTFLGILRVSPVKSFRKATEIYVHSIRSLPPPALLVFVYFGLPDAGLTLTAFWTTAACLSVYYGAYMVEVVRSGILAIPEGQVEASRAIGLSYSVAVRHVIFPQAIRNMVLPLGNIYVDVAKGTSLALLLGMFEISGYATNLAVREATPLPVFLGAGLAYILITIPMGSFFRWLSEKVAFKQ